MNNSYKLVYNEAINTWVAVAEHVSACGKKSAMRMVMAAALLAGGAAGTGWALAAPPAVNQLPTGAQVAAGGINITQTQTASAASMAIAQSSQQAIVNWQSFNVGANAKVNITQPSSTSVLLNRVMDSNPSKIFGQINANGQVMLINPNGVYFAPGSSVDVGSFTATTHGISDSDFLSGNLNFNRNGAAGSILNQGSITAGLGGYIALLAPEVVNQGVVVAQMGGTVALAAGESFQLQFSSNKQLTNVLVTPATIQTLVDNGNAVQAPGGLIILSAQAAHGLLGGVVKNSGSISATGLVNDGGVIRLSASHKIELAQSSSISADAAQGSAGNGGRIDIIADLSNASSSTQVDGAISAKGGELGGDGGFVETSATDLRIADSTRVNTLAPKGQAGNWLLDPNDFEVSSTGNISGTALSTLLTSTSVTLQAGTGTDTFSAKFANISTTGTKGDINIYDAVSWSANTLTLNAGYNINLGSSAKIGSLTVTGTGALVLNPSSTLVTGYTTNGMVLMGITNTPTGGPTGNGFNGSINLSATDSARLIASSASPVLKISGNKYTVIKTLGSSSDYSTSSNNYTLQGMAASNNVGAGFFALGNDIDATATSAWTNLNGGLGFLPIGKQAGNFPGGCDCRFSSVFDGLGHAVTNLYEYRPNVDQYSRGNVGLIAYAMFTARVANIGVTGAVSGQTSLGGLVAAFDSSSYSLPQIANSYSAVSVTVLNSSAGAVGGLVGTAGYISNSYATGNVSATGATAAGGLVGSVPNYGTTMVKIDQSFATGQVSGAGNVGGLIGTASSGSTNTITNSYATGNVSGTGSSVGGLIGNVTGITITNSYATGTVTGSNYVGGLVGFFNNGLITSSFATGNVSGPSDVGGLAGTADTTGAVTYSYATGDVTLTSSTGRAGGLIAYLPDGGSSTIISKNYASGTVSQTVGSAGNLGGLIGFGTQRTFSDNYWNSTKNPSRSLTTGGIGGSVSETSGVTALSTTSMKSASGFSSGFGNSSGTFTLASGWGYSSTSNGGLPVLCALTNCTNFVTSIMNDIFIGASGGLWSLDSNWSLGYAPSASNSATLDGAIINAGSAVNYDTASVGSISAAIQNAGTITFTGMSNVTLSGLISGVGSLTKQGSSTVTLTGTNTYSGGTTVSAGTLQAGSVTAFGTGAVSVTGGAALDLNGKVMTSTGVLTLNGTGISSGGALRNSSSTPATYAGLLALGSASSIIGGAGSIALSNAGTITGEFGLTLGGAQGGSLTSIVGTSTGSLTKQDAGTWTLTGANTYSGGTTISAGTLQIGTGSTSGSLSGNVVNSGVLAFNRSDALAYSGNISGTGAVTKLGAGTITLSGTNTYSGSTTISAGTLQVGAGSTSGSIAGDVTNNATLAFNRSDDLIYSGVISGTGAVSKSGAGTTTLTGANTYTGLTTISAGTLAISNAAGLGTTAAGTTVASGASLDLQGAAVLAEAITLDGGTLSTSTGTSSLSGTVAMTASSTVSVAGTQLTLSGVVSGSGFGLTKTDAGTLVLSGTNTFTGLSTISAGTLAISNAAGLGTTAAGTTVASGATLDLRNVAVGAEAMTLSGGTLATSTGTSSLSGAVSLGASSLLSVAGTELTLSGVIAGNNFGLALLGAGTKVLSNTSNALSIIATESNVGALSVVNGSALTIGQVTVGSTTYSGISSTGTVSVTTQSGDLTVSQSVTTSSTSSNTSSPSLKLIAGSTTAAGTATGGDIVLSGSPNFLVGSGGIAAFYAGSASLSSGQALANAVSSKTAHFVQYNKSVSELPASGAGYYALFRESPTSVYLLPVSGQTSTYGTAATALSYCYSSSASACSYLSAAGIPGAAQSFSLAGSAITSSVSVSSGVSGSLLLSGPAAVVSGFTATTNPDIYSLTLVPSLTLSGYVFSGGNAVNYTVNPKPVSITNTARSTTYDGVITYATLAAGTTFGASALVGTDAVASVTQTPGGLSGAASGTAQAGSFTVTPSSAVLGTGTASNYSFTYVDSTHTVAPANLAVSATASLSGNVYNGNAFTGAYTTTAANGESFTVTGLATGTNAGTYGSSLSVSGAALANYNTPVVTNANLVISPKPVTLSNTARSITYDGVSDYAVLATGTTFTNTDLVAVDAIGTVTQTASLIGIAQAGSFTVTPSAASLRIGSLGNYSFSYMASTHTVTRVQSQTGSQAVAVLTPTLLPAPTSNYAPPTLTVFAASSAAPSSGALGSSSGVSVNTINTSTQQVTGLVAVLVPAGTATAGTGLVIALPEQVVASSTAGSSVQVTLPNNEPLSAWIRYDSATQTLITGAVPTGAFPLSVVVTVGGQSTVIQISESQANL